MNNRIKKLRDQNATLFGKLKTLELKKKQNSKKVDLNWVLESVENYYKFQKGRDEKEALARSKKEMQDLIEQLSEDPKSHSKK